MREGRGNESDGGRDAVRACVRVCSLIYALVVVPLCLGDAAFPEQGPPSGRRHRSRASRVRRLPFCRRAVGPATGRRRT